MDFVLPEHWRQVLAVALHRHELGETLPLALHEILPSGSTVEQLISYSRVELLWVRLCFIRINIIIIKIILFNS